MITFYACTRDVRASNLASVIVTIPNVNQNLIDTATPPIPEAAAWLSGYDGQHGPALNLAQAVPGDPPPAKFLEHIAAAARTDEATRYGDIFGDEILRSAYAEECSRTFCAPISPAEVAITAGCNQAFFVSVLAVAKAGAAVLLPAPWYFNHKMTLDMLGIEARALPLSAEARFVPDASQAAQLIDEKVKAIVLVTPNNPTGAIYSAEVITSFFDLARSHNIKLIIDETYRDFREAGTPPHDLFNNADWRETVISLYSFSKSYAIPGHRLGALITGAQLREQIGKALDCIQICPARAAQLSLPWAMEHLRDWRKDITAKIITRGSVFRSAMAALPHWKIDQLGAYFAYVRHPFNGVPATLVAERLAVDCGLLALPGSYFGPGQDQHLRMAFANVSQDEIAMIPDRLAVLDETELLADAERRDTHYG